MSLREAQQTQISYGPNPIRDKIEAVFGEGSTVGMIFAYDHTIYADEGTTVPVDLIFHEGVHFIQQDKYGGADAWWDEYLSNPMFRFDQELEAYGKQIARYTSSNSVSRSGMLDWAAEAMSSVAYGGMITYKDARKALKQYVKELEA